jgi:DNA-binding transcriptional LysR family regulator
VRLSQLERKLGTRLVQRTTRRLSLTSDGLALYEHAARVTAEADLATSAWTAGVPEPRGIVRISAPVSFAALRLTVPIAAYLERFPRVRVEFLVTDRLVDLVAEGVDVALRLSAGLRDSSLVGRKLAEGRTVVCASPAYLARKGTPVSPAELIHHDCVRYSALKASDEWRFRADGKSFGVPVNARFESTSGLVVLEAALAGMGLVVLPSFACAEHLATGRLQQVLAPFTFIRLVLHAVYPSAGVVRPSVRALVDLLAEHMQQTPSPWSIRGQSPPAAARARPRRLR